MFPHYLSFVLLAQLIYASSILDIDELLDLDPASCASILTPFNMTRKVGSQNSKLTREIIRDFFQYQVPLEWDVEEISFQEAGHNFTNLIATLPYYRNLRENSVFGLKTCAVEHKRKDVIFAVHYDTIYKIPGFVGAIDSAASMAILLHNAYAFSHSELSRRSLRPYNLKMVFFDGEEAFDTWTATDSLYGSRHMARTTDVGNVALFVLLDLIGAKDTGMFYNYDRKTEHFYRKLVDIDRALPSGSSSPLFEDTYVGNGIIIEDDHVPFKKRGVPCLHLLPLPFPSTWHTEKDDFESLDIKKIHRVSQILLKFTKDLFC
ncbi:unnamed protein product [Hanseniaspora opuntiae]